MVGVPSGDRKAVEQLAARLCVPPIALTNAAHFEAMADHVEQLTAFETNRLYRQLFWAALGGIRHALRSLAKHQ